MDDEAVLELHLQGFTTPEIALTMGVTEGTVGNCLRRLRRRLGPDAVPYHSDVQRMIKNEARAFKPDAGDIPETWAGCFRLLAHRLRDINDAEGWALAQRIAKERHMRDL